MPKFTGTNVVGNSLIYDSGTNVGIGTASPSSRVHISATGATEAKLEGTTAAYLSFIRSGVNFGYVGLGSPGNSDIYIYNLNSGAVRINAQAVYVTATNLVGINETAPGSQLQVTTGAAATKGLIVKGASAQSANLQEWQNSAGTALAYVNSAGDIWGAGGGIFTGTGNATDGYGESGSAIGVNKWLAYNSPSIYFNIRKLYGSRTFPATNANGDYVEIAKIPRSQVHPITLTIHASHAGASGSVGKVYIIHSNHLWGNFTAAPISSAAVGDFEFDVEVIAIDAYWSAVRARRRSSATLGSAALMFTIESHNYNRGGMVELSGTGNSASALGYRSDYQCIGPTVSAPPPVGGSGAGTDLAIYAASAAGTGSGGNIYLIAGAFATSGSNGKVIVRGLASNTANLQEWQNNAGSLLSAVNSAGDFTNTGGQTQAERFGAGASVGGSYDHAFGRGASASGALSLAAGWSSTASGGTATAIGAQSSATGGTCVAVGRQAGAVIGATAVGASASAGTGNAIAIGRSTTSGAGGTAIGYNFTGTGLGYTSLCASTDGAGSTGAIDVFAGDGVNINTNISRQHSILGTWSVATYASRLGRVQLRVNDFTTDREAIRYESNGANALTSIGGAAVIASTTLAVQPAVSGNKGIVVKGASGQSANLLELQSNAGTALALVDASGNVLTTGSIQITSNTPAAFTADQNNLALTASGFQRLSGTAARNITGIAPPSGSHVDGRMIRLYNVGSFNLTLKHNSTSSTAANRFFNVQAIDIIVGANDYAELIYDGTNNGSGAAGWRVA